MKRSNFLAALVVCAVGTLGCPQQDSGLQLHISNESEFSARIVMMLDETPLEISLESGALQDVDNLCASNVRIMSVELIDSDAAQTSNFESAVITRGTNYDCGEVINVAITASETRLWTVSDTSN